MYALTTHRQQHWLKGLQTGRGPPGMAFRSGGTRGVTADPAALQISYRMSWKYIYV
jgi:hypothetical protein